MEQSVEESAEMHFLSVNPAQPLNDDQLIVRYMKVSTFLLLLRGRVFIPSLNRLQRADPSESAVLSRIFQGKLAVRSQDEEWFRSRADDMERRMIHFSHGSLPEAVAYEIWLRELALRRCIWCWYAERPESMGMWNNYGPHGIAIVSKVKNVREALSLPVDALTSVGRVIYVPAERHEGVGSQDEHKSLFNRPYYFKQEAYKYESEIRFVLACEPIVTGFKGGILLKIDPKILIEEVLISPHIIEDEAYALQELIVDTGLVPYDRIKLSSLLYPGPPAFREWFRETMKDSDPLLLKCASDILSGVHQDKDSNGLPIARLMRSV